MRLTDKEFIYTPSFQTNIALRFERIIAAQKASAKAAEEQAKQDAEEAARKVARRGIGK